jgi:steroid delta-isomerase
VLTSDQLRRRISDYVDGVNSRDASVIAACFTEDAVHADPVSNPPNVGRAAIATFFESGIAASDGWTFTASDLHTCAHQVAMHFAIAVETGGASMTIEGIEVFRVDDAGLFRSVHAYWDDSDVSL